MACIGMVIEKTEAYADSVEMARVVLPGDKIIEKYKLGWDNFVHDEIELLIMRFKLGGELDDYELAVCTPDGIVKMLPPRDVVEDHSEELLRDCTLTLVPKGTNPGTIQHLCHLSKEKQLEMKEEINS